MPKTVITDVFVAQVYLEVVPSNSGEKPIAAAFWTDVNLADEALRQVVQHSSEL